MALEVIAGHLMDMVFHQRTHRIPQSQMPATPHLTTAVLSPLRCPTTVPNPTWNQSAREHYPDRLASSTLHHCQDLSL